ncbi:MAG: DUF86 domain-containing protein [Nitrospinae bacterium]|nr:DUF86 domain-containing protein [Nitrospinota bacterium]MBF0633689.1 DUF86 domain-containing protein [Nitrospinota bacterium]
MPVNERDASYLFDILKAAGKIAKYVEGKKADDFQNDDLLRDAVERNLGIIGEAVRRLSGSFKEEHSDIPWRGVIALRNVLVHEYDSVSGEEIWDVVTVHLPRLADAIRPIMPPPPSGVEG